MKINREVCERSGCHRFVYPEASAVVLSLRPFLCIGAKWDTKSEDRSSWTDSGIVPEGCPFETEQAVSQ